MPGELPAPSILATARLDLRPLTADQLALLLSNPALLARGLGLALAAGLVDEPVSRAIRMKLQKMAGAAAQHHLWYTYWLIVVREASIGVGTVGFKGFPDAEGEVEIGYGIDQAFRGFGYMTEAVQALIDWAFAQPACRSIVAVNTLKPNVASHRVLQKVGMQVYQENAEGLDWRLTRPTGRPGK